MAELLFELGYQIWMIIDIETYDKLIKSMNNEEAHIQLLS